MPAPKSTSPPRETDRKAPASGTRPAQRRTGPPAHADLTVVPETPDIPSDPRGFIVPMSTGNWRCAPASEPGYPRGVYQEVRIVDPESGTPDTAWVHRAMLPWKHATVIRRDGSGDRTDTDYVLSATLDGPRALITGQRVQSGEWARALGIPLSADPKIMQAVGTAIFLMKPIDPTEREAVPRSEPDGRPTIPAPETLPPGYLRTGPLPEDQAMAMWRELLTPVAAENPKFALAAGGSAISPFFGWLDHSDVMAFIIDAFGPRDCGKTTMHRTCGSIWGHCAKTGGVVGSWNMSKQGPGRTLGQLGILPAFFDEQGVSGFTAEQWFQVIYGITDGARRAADRADGMRITLPYTGVILSAGNASITAGGGYGKYAGIGPKRVITLTGPFTTSAEQAESVKPLCREAYGWPGRAILSGFDGARVLALLDDAIRIVGLPDGPSRTAAKNLHLLVAGAAILDAVLGTGNTIRDSAVTGAREFLAANSHEPERDADRMLTELREAIASEPARWPTVTEYREHKLTRPQWTDGTVEPGRTELPQHGVDRHIAGVQADDGTWFAVFGRELEELCDRIGTDKPATLADADQRGWLHRTGANRRNGDMATMVKHVGRIYRFNLLAVTDDEDQAADDGPTEPDDGPAPTPADPADDWLIAAVNAAPELPTLAACREAWRQADQAGPQERDALRALIQTRAGDLRQVGECAGCHAPMTVLVIGQTCHPDPECERKAREEARQATAPVQPELPDAAPEPSTAPGSADPRAAWLAATWDRADNSKYFKAPERKDALERIVTLLDENPDLADKDAVTSLADRLRLLDEMEGQGQKFGGPFMPQLRGRAAWIRPWKRGGVPVAVEMATVIEGYSFERDDYHGPLTVFDRNGAWIGSIGTTLVAHGGLDHTGAREPSASSTLPGYYLVHVYEWSERDMPSPLGNATPGTEVWVPAPTMGLLVELAAAGRWPDAAALDSWTGTSVRLDAWGRLIREVRRYALETHGYGSGAYQAAKDAISKSISMMNGTLADDSTRPVRVWSKCKNQRIDWRHQIITNSAVATWRCMDRCRQLTEGNPALAPIGIRAKDEFLIPSAAAELVTSQPYPGGTRPPVRLDPTGVELGTCKVKGEETR